MNFQEWIVGYELEYKKALKKWHENSRYKNVIPEGFDEKLLQKYTAYRTEMETKKLVKATWVLAIATIVLSILTIILG